MRLGVWVLAAVACGSPAVSPEGPGDDWALDTDTDTDIDTDADRAPTPATPAVDPPEHVAPSPAARPRPAPAATATDRRLYRGHRIDVAFVDIDLHDAFRTLSRIGDVSIVVADDVRGTVTLRVRQVPWDQVLDTIARLEGLRVDVDGGIYRITRP